MVQADDGRPPHRIDHGGDVILTKVGQIHSLPVEDLLVAEAPLVARHFVRRGEELAVVNAGLASEALPFSQSSARESLSISVQWDRKSRRGRKWD
ncbi:hypothetical protein SAY87_032177 [Trapa incisa]|uniref:Uncharacterized protein n=1 Tax=Trapa incisa TaxID=236973 RepID=A0AAN7KRH5_9MYRT|nr:hypothetical protein SAY87_032177 [Trapa incisa]